VASYLSQNPQIDLQEYNESEVEWSQLEMTMIIDLILADNRSLVLILDLQPEVEILDLALPEWRETIKPQILSQFKELGIEA
jgi:hypothetical protein